MKNKIIFNALAGLILIILMTNIASATWWDAGWTNKKQINISGGNSELINFTIYFNVSYDNNMQVDFKDLRFINSAEDEELPYEFDNVINSNSAGVWITFPTLNAGTNNNTIYMYYGNASATDGQNKIQTWRQYKRVFHLNADTSTLAYESSSGKNGTIYSGNSTQTFEGKIGNALHFNKTRAVNLSQSGVIFGTTQMTVSGWFKSDISDTNQRYGWDYQWIGDAWGRCDWNNGAASKIQAQAYNGTVYSLTNNTNNVTTWIYVTQTMKAAGQHTLYINGVKSGTFYMKTLTQVAGRTGGMIGANYGYNLIADPYPFWGLIDEFRMMNVQMTDDWVFRDYQNANMSYFTFGDEEAFPTGNTCTPPTTGNWAITCSDNCSWFVGKSIPGNVTITGAGTLNLNSIWHFTTAKSRVTIAPTCRFNINRGGGFNNG